jgi:cAMP phosphodiesterase
MPVVKAFSLFKEKRRNGKMEIRVLGCHGSQLPGYGTTSFLLNRKILLDGGTITSVLTAAEQQNIEYIFVTHAHLDHVRDIMFLADNLGYMPRERPLVILSTPHVIATLRRYLFNGVIWPDFSAISNAENPIIKFESLSPGATVAAAGLDITAVKVSHTVETVGYVIETDEGSVIFTGDTGPTDEIWRIAETKKKKLRAIFMETSLPTDMQSLADKTGHLTPASLEQELRKLGDIEVPIYLYHTKAYLHEVIKAELALLMESNLHILEDGQILQIGAL